MSGRSTEKKPDGREPGERVSGASARLLVIAAPVVFASAAVVFAAAVSLASSQPSLNTLSGLLALLLASTFVEAFPVPVAGVSAGGVSLAAVFVVGVAVIYGWAPAALIAFLTRALIELVQRRPAIKLLYNSAAYGLAGAASGFAVLAAGRTDSVVSTLFQVLVGAATFYVVNVALIVVVVARANAEDLVPLMLRSARLTALPFGIMASLSLILAMLWERSPGLSAALVGPLLAVALYQRSVHRALEALQLARTDPLTGLGNHRFFHEQLEKELNRARLRRSPLTLCMLDIDNFKQINDRWGHPVGDRVLAHVGSLLRHDGEAFRLGGDEFAVILAEHDGEEALAVVRTVLDRITASAPDVGAPITVSAGLASFPQHGSTRGQLISVADSALYLAKRLGKNRVRTYRRELAELARVRESVGVADRQARLQAASALASAVDARDAYTGNHSRRVAELSARLARRIGLPEEEIELIRLAGNLHDLGKLAIPEGILRKHGRLGEDEIQILRKHPEIGYRMLDSLGIAPVADWILHHHERWDGKGYPDGLSGEEIPLEARIIFVADAYDAMVSDRVYNGSSLPAAAIEELERCAGTQFDPGVVAALIAELGEASGPRPLAAVSHLRVSA